MYKHLNLTDCKIKAEDLLEMNDSVLDKRYIELHLHEMLIARKNDTIPKLMFRFIFGSILIISLCNTTISLEIKLLCIYSILYATVTGCKSVQYKPVDMYIYEHGIRIIHEATWWNIPLGYKEIISCDNIDSYSYNHKSFNIKLKGSIQCQSHGSKVSRKRYAPSPIVLNTCDVLYIDLLKEINIAMNMSSNRRS